LSGADHRPTHANLICSVGFAEDAVDLAAGVVDDVDDPVLLLLVGGVGGLCDGADQLRDSAAQVDVAGLDAVGDLLPRRGLDFLRGGAAVVGQLEKLLAAVTFACHQQALVDQQLQRRVDRAGAGPPQVLAALGDLLDHLVAMHWPLGQELEDRGADIATLAASPTAAPASARTGPESEAEAATRIEAELEAVPRAEPEVALKAEAGVVFAEMVAKVLAELSTRLTPLLMERAAVAGPKAEAESARRWCEWVGHRCFLTFDGKRRDALPIRRRYIGNYRDATSTGVVVATYVTTTTPPGAAQ
jgi:hypothetical protein